MDPSTSVNAANPKEQERERLRWLGVRLDQCWDLLHQRRALRSAGRDPNEAKARDEQTVEGYVD